MNEIAKKNKIKDFGAIFKLEDLGERKIEATINSINANKPVVIGINFTESLLDLHTNLWKPKPNEATIGGHAVTVIGFDKNKKTFEIINSWGTEWGNQGFFEISFNDYAKYVKYGYQLVLENRNEANNTISLQGDFIFKKYTGFDEVNNKYIFSAINPTLENNEYTIQDGLVQVGDFFQLEAKNIKKDSYVYVFSLKPDGTTELLFPETELFVDKYTKNKLPKPQKPMVFAQNMRINIPKASDEGLETDQAGTDILCILYAYYEIPDIHSKINLIQKSESISFREKLAKAFSTNLIANEFIEYTPNKMQVKASANSGTIVPLILKVNVK